jgi:hypothetical protein
MAVTACPACGETERLLGRTIEGDIEVTCGECGARWMRGAPRCKTCGAAEAISVEQRMTRHPRGTLLSVVGVREVPLCSDCDADVLATALRDKQPVPEGYVSRFLFDAKSRRPSPKPTPTPPRTSKPARATTQATTVSDSRPGPPAPPPLTDPTVRQAVELYLGEAEGPSDSIALVLFGSEFGSSTRLRSLDSDETSQRIAEWVQRTWGARTEQRTRAVETLCAAFGYWRSREWVTRDLCCRLG